VQRANPLSPVSFFSSYEVLETCVRRVEKVSCLKGRSPIKQKNKGLGQKIKIYSLAKKLHHGLFIEITSPVSAFTSVSTFIVAENIPNIFAVLDPSIE
jgi:hypothetical protein